MAKKSKSVVKFSFNPLYLFPVVFVLLAAVFLAPWVLQGADLTASYMEGKLLSALVMVLFLETPLIFISGFNSKHAKVVEAKIIRGFFYSLLYVCAILSLVYLNLATNYKILGTLDCTGSSGLGSCTLDEIGKKRMCAFFFCKVTPETSYPYILSNPNPGFSGH